MEAGSWSEVRFESSATTVGFSEPCAYCGNRKRRCLLPPTRSRKKVLVFEAASVLSPPSSPTRPVLLRPESSPLASFRSAGLSVTPSQPPHSPFLRSHPAFPGNLESAAEAFRSPPPTAEAFRSPPPTVGMTAPPDRCPKRFDFSKSTPLAAKTALVNDKKGALNVNINCGPGIVCKALISNP